MEPLISWLQELNMELEDIYESWSTGYPVGSILYQYGWQDDFYLFKNKPIGAKDNISRLSENLQSCRVKVNFESSDEEYIKSTLLRLRQFLKSNPAPKKAVKKVLKKHQTRVVEKKSLVPEKIQQIEGKLGKYQNEKAIQSKAAYDGMAKANQDFADYQQTIRQDRIQTLKDNKEFLNTWQEEGKNNWKTNMKTKRANEERDLYFRTEKAMTYKNKVLNYIQSNEDDELNGIDEFERNLIALGIDHAPADGATAKKRNLAAEAADAMNRIRANRVKNEEARKQREIRIVNLVKEQDRTARVNTVRQCTKTLGDQLEKIVGIRQRLGFGLIQRHIKITTANLDADARLQEKTVKRQEEIEAVEAERKEFFAQVEKNKVFERKLRRQRILELNIKSMKEKHARSKRAIDPILDDILQIMDFEELTPDEWSSAMGIFLETEQNSAREKLLKVFAPDEEFVPREFDRSPSPELPQELASDENAIAEENEEDDETLNKVPSITYTAAAIQEASEEQELPTSKRRR